MKRDEIITKAEKQLDFVMKKIQESTNKSTKAQFAKVGMAQLDMLDLILDEEYEGYRKYLEAFAFYD